MGNSKDANGLDYWLRWHVLVCSLLFILPTAISVILIKRVEREPIDPTRLWVPCWRNLNPRWLLFYRVFAFVSMAFLLYQTVATFGFFVFFFYTQWTFALVMIYFALATVVSVRGCQMYSRNPIIQSGERDKFLKRDPRNNNYEFLGTPKEKQIEGFIRFQGLNAVPIERPAGFWENLMQIVYQTCAGAVMLTDIVFWCLLLPFMSGENFQLTLLIGCMHSVNAIFLLLDSALNRLAFPWSRIIYFVIWSCAYVVFQWILHACCFTWWPYPFLELSSPLAPLWYFGLALVHIPCYGLYCLLIKAKDSVFSRMFPRAFVRVSLEKKEM